MSKNRNIFGGLKNALGINDKTEAVPIGGLPSEEKAKAEEALTNASREVGDYSTPKEKKKAQSFGEILAANEAKRKAKLNAKRNAQTRESEA